MNGHGMSLRNRISGRARASAPWKSCSLVVFLLCAAAFAPGCRKPGGGGPVDTHEGITACTQNSQCAEGNVCNAGACVVGVYDPALTGTCKLGEDPYC